MQEQEIRTNQFTFYLQDEENLLEKTERYKKANCSAKKVKILWGENLG